MKIKVITLDIGNLYQESDRLFCISPRSWEKPYTHCIMMKPMRLAIIPHNKEIPDELLESLITHMNNDMMNLDGFIWVSENPSIWLVHPSSIILDTIDICSNKIVSEYSDFIIAHSEVSIDHIDIPE